MDVLVATNLDRHNIVFRVDASLQMGSGHVMRCLTLANGLRGQGAEVSFICREHLGHLCDFISSLNFRVVRLPALEVEGNADSGISSTWELGSLWEEDAEITQEIIRSWCVIPDFLIVDHYGLDKKWEVKLQRSVEKIVVIDDLADREHDCVLLLDQNLHRGMEGRYQALVPDACSKLLGPKYALLRPEFLAERKKMKPRSGEIKRVLIFFGGSDPANITGQLMKAINVNLFRQIQFEVVIGVSNIYKAEIQSLCDGLVNVKLHIQVNNMAALMAQSDLAIGAGGATIWERCCMGLPSIMLTIADNQKAVASQVIQKKIGFLVGHVGEVDFKVIVNLLTIIQSRSFLIKEIGKRAECLVDGLGVKRVVSTLLGHLSGNGEAVFLRDFTVNDSNKVYQWQTSPWTRKYFRNPTPPTWSEHVKWMDQRIENGSCSKIIVCGEKAVGVIRLDSAEVDDEYEVSILLGEEFSGLGIARQALKLLLVEHGDKILIAEIHQENTSSIRLFVEAGFVRLGNLYRLGKEY